MQKSSTSILSNLVGCHSLISLHNAPSNYKLFHQKNLRQRENESWLQGRTSLFASTASKSDAFFIHHTSCSSVVRPLVCGIWRRRFAPWLPLKRGESTCDTAERSISRRATSSPSGLNRVTKVLSPITHWTSISMSLAESCAIFVLADQIYDDRTGSAFSNKWNSVAYSHSGEIKTNCNSFRYGFTVHIFFFRTSPQSSLNKHAAHIYAHCRHFYLGTKCKWRLRSSSRISLRKVDLKPSLPEEAALTYHQQATIQRLRKKTPTTDQNKISYKNRLLKTDYWLKPSTSTFQTFTRSCPKE